MGKKKPKPRGKKNGYCVRTLDVFEREYDEHIKGDFEQRKAALKARLKARS